MRRLAATPRFAGCRGSPRRGCAKPSRRGSGNGNARVRARRTRGAAARGASRVDERSGDAPELARRYAEFCARKFAPAVPLLWPRRTGGRALRIVVIVGALAAASHRDGAGDDSCASPRTLRGTFAAIGEANDEIELIRRSPATETRARHRSDSRPTRKRRRKASRGARSRCADRSRRPHRASGPVTGAAARPHHRRPLPISASRNVAPLIDDELPAAELSRMLTRAVASVAADGRCSARGGHGGAVDRRVRAHQRGEWPARMKSTLM